MTFGPDRVESGRTLLEMKSAAKQVKTATYGMQYGGSPEMDGLLWTGIQRLLQAKGLNPGPVDGKPGRQMYEALSWLAVNGLSRELKTAADWVPPPLPTSETSPNDTSEIDGARFRLLEKKP